MSGPPEITLFIGRLHPLLVHLPIGLIVLLALLEALGRFPRFASVRASAGFILALAAPLAAFTALCGWMLSRGGAYGSELLQWHKWMGIATAAACALTALCYSLDAKKLYRLCLGSTLATLIIASHFGGSLTHGSDYLVRYAPQPLRGWLGSNSKPAPLPGKTRKDLRDVQAFADIVQPLLSQDCVGCHGPEKSEAALRVDSLAALVKGGKSGPAIAAGKGGESLLVKRLRLPLHEKEHMPPEGKPQPAADQITLLQWWIDAGAPLDKTVAQLKPPAPVLRALEVLFGDPSRLARKTAPKPANEIQPLVSKLADDLGIAVSLVSSSEPWVQCNASIAGTNFGDAELRRLAPIAANLRWLDLAGTSVTDAGLALLASMPSLTRLHLERTAVQDAGLARLIGLEELQYLNLYGTEVTDAGLAQLQTLPELKQLYLWQTKVTPSAAKAFAETLTDHDLLQAWQDEIDRLNAKIRGERLSIELGTPPATPSTNAAPINAQCPVSGKPVDPTKTVLYQGALVAFCCDDCKAKFQQDPKPLLTKLGLNATAPDQKTGNN